MKKDWKYVAFLTLIFGIYVWLQLTAPKQHSWDLSLDYTGKEPYGAIALYRLLPSLFNEGVEVSTKTFYELQDSLSSGDNFFVLARRFDPGKEDIVALLAFAEKGHNVFLSAEAFGYKLKDTLKVETQYNFLSNATFNKSDSVFVEFNNETLQTDEKIYFKTINLENKFTKYIKDSASVFAITERDDVITLRIPWGKGNIFLNTTPAAFTNIYALRENHKFISASLSPLPATKLVWLESYQVGHRELSTPLRYILTNEPLAWAYYLTIFSILFFMVFEAKRKQRPIPIIPPLTNNSLEFAGTIGNLYYQRGDHKNIAEKRIHFFFDYVRTHFYLQGHEPDFIQRLSAKSAKPEQEIRSLITAIQSCVQAKSITVNELSELNRKIEEFYQTGKT
jgi:hypothetical protein